MRLRSLGLPLFITAVSFGAVHCGGGIDPATPDPPDGSASSSSSSSGSSGSAEGGGNHDATGATTSSKVDLLLVVDNSASMSEKGKALAASVGTLIKSLAATNDMHIGVIDTSLGTFGGDVCANGGTTNSLAHLHTNGPGGAVAGAAQGFLSYSAGGSIDATVADAQELVLGVGQTGCGLEAQLESAYRFLVQPDPWLKVNTTNGVATLDGLDTDLLAQRKKFLREDSLVAVVMLTDEDDSGVDPLSIGGQGWGFSNTTFPGSTQIRADGKTTTAPRATSVCATDPASAECTSCGFAATCNATDAACQKIKNDPQCKIDDGYYGPQEDSLNTRFVHMKQRFGIDPQFPVERYSDGFTKALVPNRTTEHKTIGQNVVAYDNAPTCTNPLFATALPETASDENCHLATGARGKDLVVFAVIGGVPETLATASPDWTKVVGANPSTYDESGKDVHMQQSITPRAGLPGPSAAVGDNGSDPVSGREWDTLGADLQYACTFALPTALPPSRSGPNDCGFGTNPPLCAADGSQTRGKAYPTIRELRVAQALGERGVIGSICPTDATLGYVSTMQILADRLTPRLALVK